ncbi:hypothetical protein GT028_04065 [Streptomyces sp. SID2999]|uniref:hypothetical protein n=1 Tax=Streptomyces sp. SID2999 TaxID=2690258 RepID=UPI001370160A|nr:hypothetical protein [Streptomyces sp. SID2999]MYZ06550.1 hypothetical protein [Streptomyces sp. SID2999]
MTDFMQRISDLLHHSPEALGSPTLIETVEKTTGQGAHDQVEHRAYAEQLLCEANAVLVPETATALTLQDHAGTLDQVFTISYGPSWARIATRFRGGRARAELLGSSFEEPQHQLLDTDALEDLIVTLVADAQTSAPPAEGATL